MTPLASIDANNLALVRGGRVLFRDLSFRLRAGQMLAVEGRNGAGKTSLLRAIAGFLAPHAGEIVARTRDGDAFADGEARSPLVGWLGHQDGLKPQLTPRETLNFFARYYGQATDIAQALERIGLASVDALPVMFLSAGQKKRLSLARLLLSGRPLWLLDEPLAALDAPGRTFVGDIVAAHCRTGGIVIAATHEALGTESSRVVLGAP